MCRPGMCISVWFVCLYTWVCGERRCLHLVEGRHVSLPTNPSTVYTCIYLYTLSHPLSLSLQTLVLYTPVYTCVCTCIYLYTCICLCMYMYLCYPRYTCIHPYIPVHLYIPVYTCSKGPSLLCGL